MNASHDLSDLIKRLEWAKLGKNPLDAKAMKRLADEIKRRTDLKRLDYGPCAGVRIRHDGTLEPEEPQQAERGHAGGAAGEVRHFGFTDEGVLYYAKDASGHEHKGTGPGGGQFTGAGGANGSSPSEQGAIHRTIKGAKSYKDLRKDIRPLAREHDKQFKQHVKQIVLAKTGDKDIAHSAGYLAGMQVSNIINIAMDGATNKSEIFQAINDQIAGDGWKKNLAIIFEDMDTLGDAPLDDKAKNAITEAFSNDLIKSMIFGKTAGPQVEIDPDGTMPAS